MRVLSGLLDEIEADFFFRKRLYPQVKLFQDLLGTVSDHAMTKQLSG